MNRSCFSFFFSFYIVYPVSFSVDSDDPIHYSNPGESNRDSVATSMLAQIEAGRINGITNFYLSAV